ncbi:MAG: flagellar hook-length control protein FliK [Campylobacterota bacterium]|nr:flagellar hook-length control protein FliK [Campylobacterota bacterium]
MINTLKSSNLDIFLPNTNKALSLVLKELTHKELEMVSNTKNLKSILRSILKQSLNNNSVNNNLLQLIRNNPTLKNLGNVSDSIKDLINIIKSNKELLPIEKKLNSFLTNLDDVKNIDLKQKFHNSGIFLESKLKSSRYKDNLQDILTNDLKAILSKISNETTSTSNLNQAEITKQIDKLLLQIDHHQLVSHLSNSSSLFLPFSWDLLEEGNIELKKAKDNKFFCDINLKLQEYGELNLKLTLYDKNQLNIHIYSNNKDFKELIREKLSTLRSALIDIKITPREIRIFKIEKDTLLSLYQNIDNNLKLGFEVKG